jgi:signal transduction histidine kinase
MGTRMISITLGPVLNSKDALMGAVALFRDITREVESDRLKTEFIGTVSHELRTPMTSIKGFTQLLSMGSLGPVNDTQKEFLQIIQTNAERMISIINDLLDITKIETGSVELDLRPLHLAETLSTVMMELQPAIREREHELVISIPPGLPLVRADSRRLNQILGNVLSNAVKYTPRGGKIELDAREVGSDGVPEQWRDGLKPDARYALVEIRDSGVGIAAEDLDRIFDRFYRTENPLKVEAGGTGLGLSLVRPLIELFGGRIWVQSVLGEGSTFSMLIPAALELARCPGALLRQRYILVERGNIVLPRDRRMNLHDPPAIHGEHRLDAVAAIADRLAEWLVRAHRHGRHILFEEHQRTLDRRAGSIGQAHHHIVVLQHRDRRRPFERDRHPVDGLARDARATCAATGHQQQQQQPGPA